MRGLRSSRGGGGDADAATQGGAAVFDGHALTDKRNGLIVGACDTTASAMPNVRRY